MKTYYMQIKDAVLPKLEYYQDDLLKHDRRALKTYQGEFIHASRDTGTDLILFDNIDSAKHYKWAATFALRSSNDLFLHGVNGRVKEITRDRAIAIARAGARCLAAKEAKQRYPDDIDYKLMNNYYSRVLPDYLKPVPPH